MARREKKVKLQGRDSITVFELNLKQIRELIGLEKKLDGLNPLDLLGILETEILPMATSLESDVFEDLAPSEIKELFLSWKEINTDFFGVMGTLGILPDLQIGLTEPEGKMEILSESSTAGSAT